jgi:hypothetical protein
MRTPYRGICYVQAYPKTGAPLISLLSDPAVHCGNWLGERVRLVTGVSIALQYRSSNPPLCCSDRRTYLV